MNTVAAHAGTVDLVRRVVLTASRPELLETPHRRVVISDPANEIVPKKRS